MVDFGIHQPQWQVEKNDNFQHCSPHTNLSSFPRHLRYLSCYFNCLPPLEEIYNVIQPTW